MAELEFFCRRMWENCAVAETGGFCVGVYKKIEMWWRQGSPGVGVYKKIEMWRRQESPTVGVKKKFFVYRRTSFRNGLKIFYMPTLG